MSTHAAHNAPLHPHPNDSEGDKEFTIEYAVDYWLRLGADPRKIVIFKILSFKLSFI